MFGPWRPLAFALAYALLAYVCLAFTRFGSPVEALWLANALLAAVLVSLPRAKWPEAIILAACAHLGAHVAIGDDLTPSISFLIADLGEATLFAALFIKSESISSARLRVLAVAAACLASPLVSAAVLAGLASLVQLPLSTGDFVVWVAVDALGYLIFFPLFRGFQAAQWRKVRAQPWLFLALLICVVGLAAIGAMTQSPLPRLLFLPLIVGITLTFGRAGALAGLGTLLITWVVFSVGGYPPAGWPGMPNADQRALLLLAQAFVAAVAVTVIPLAIFLEEREGNALSLERKIAERTEELGRALMRAEAADRTKSVFLATMSHELRTPLNSIIGFSGILAQGWAGPVNDEQAKQLRMVRASARHLLELINDVLDISKIEAGEVELHREAFDVLEPVRKVAELLAPAAHAKGITFEVTSAEPSAQLTSDRRRVEQILLNLAGNAVKFTESGGVRIDVEAGPGAEVVRIRVTDSGIGIRPENFGALFEPFRQIQDGVSRPHEGTGLGLAISNRLAQLLDARIEVQSEWGRGSVFTLTLPAPSAADTTHNPVAEIATQK